MLFNFSILYMLLNFRMNSEMIMKFQILTDFLKNFNADK